MIKRLKKWFGGDYKAKKEKQHNESTKTEVIDVEKLKKDGKKTGITKDVFEAIADIYKILSDNIELYDLITESIKKTDEVIKRELNNLKGELQQIKDKVDTIQNEGVQTTNIDLKEKKLSDDDYLIVSNIVTILQGEEKLPMPKTKLIQTVYNKAKKRKDNYPSTRNTRIIVNELIKDGSLVVNKVDGKQMINLKVEKKVT